MFKHVVDGVDPGVDFVCVKSLEINAGVDGVDFSPMAYIIYYYLWSFFHQNGFLVKKSTPSTPDLIINNISTTKSTPNRLPKLKNRLHFQF